MVLRGALHSHAHRLAPVPTQKMLRPELKPPIVSLLLRVERHNWAHSDKGDLAEVPNWLLGPLCPAPGPVKTAQGRPGSGGLGGRWVPGSGRYIGMCPYHRALRMTCWGFLNALWPQAHLRDPNALGHDAPLCLFVPSFWGTEPHALLPLAQDPPSPAAAAPTQRCLSSSVL